MGRLSEPWELKVHKSIVIFIIETNRKQKPQYHGFK